MTEFRCSGRRWRGESDCATAQGVVAHPVPCLRVDFRLSVMVAGRAHDNCWVSKKAQGERLSRWCELQRCPAKPHVETTGRVGKARNGDNRGGFPAAWGGGTSTGPAGRGGPGKAEGENVRCRMPTLSGSPVARSAGPGGCISSSQSPPPPAGGRKKAGPEGPGPATRGVVKPSRAPTGERSESSVSGAVHFFILGPARSWAPRRAWRRRPSASGDRSLRTVPVSTDTGW